MMIASMNAFEPRSGGELRVHHLARELARRGHRVHILAFVGRPYPTGRCQLAPGLCAEQRHAWPLDGSLVASRLGWVPPTELPMWYRFLRGSVARAIRTAGPDVVEFHFPWHLPLYEAVPKHVPIIYASHNIESRYWKPVLASFRLGRGFRRRLARYEIKAARKADAVSVCSEAERNWLRRMAGLPVGRLCLVGNGYDASATHRISREDRRHVRERFGFGPEKKIALFVGSDTVHNRWAARTIVNDIAPVLADEPFHFVIVGTVGRAFDNQAPRANVFVTGPLEDVSPWFQAADVGLNPVRSGSGTQLKMPEYLAAGLAVVTTPVGLRGYEALRPWVLVREPKAFAEAIRVAEWPNEVPTEQLEALTWAASACRLEQLYQRVLAGPTGREAG